MKLSDIKVNPRNPQTFDDLSILEASVNDFPKMFKYRPIVVDNDGMVLGGNKRLICLQRLGFKEIPNEWVKVASDLTEDEKRRFIISDNVGHGQWAWDVLKEDWDENELESWGVEMPEYLGKEPDYEDLIGENKDKPATLKITFESVEQLQKAEIDIQELIDRKYKGAYFSVSAGEI